MRFFKILSSLCGGLLVGVLVINQGWSQEKRRIRYYVREEEASTLALLRLPIVIVDSAGGFQFFKDTISKIHSKGYLTASIDSTVWKKDTLFVWLHIGNPFKWVRLRSGNVAESVLNEVGFREKIYQNRLFRYSEVAALEQRILNYAEEHGYPFATTQLDSIEVNDQSVSAVLHYTPGVRIVLDTLQLIGTARLKRKFLANWLRLYPGQPYNQSKLDQADALLKQQPYLVANRPYEVLFKNDRAYITFYADAGKASEADGIVGFQPNEQEKGRLLLTGELNLRLRNLFSSGGNFSFSWQQIKRASPRLNISYTQPAFLSTPLEVNASFQLLREDSATSIQNGFLTLSQQANVFYNLSSYTKVGAGVERRTSRLADSTLQVVDNEVIPRQANTNWLAYNAYYTYNRLDNFFYPRQGWWVNGIISIGNKQVPDSEQLSTNNAPVQGSSPQFSYRFTARKYHPVGRKATLLVQLSGGQILNANLFQNDLFRLGGLTSLRGFNENFFFASAYGSATLEYRFFWETTSYLFTFYDQAWLQTRILKKVTSDVPSGLGAGISFSTKAGIFTVVYALGNSRDRSLGIGFSKIHFGLVSRF